MRKLDRIDSDIENALDAKHAGENSDMNEHRMTESHFK